ncbi:MAG TPA: M48 family metallopeptidase [Gemmatales bacterium]|nr:M48 family metallopeptidase [Gemmatales bacterium]HMP59028.1 M48 family metallopeptidase [Gemmatales bacterium]
MSMGSRRAYGQSGFKLWPLLLGLLVAGFYMARGCQEGPFGRTQIVGLSPGEEAALGAQAFKQVLANADVVASGPGVEVVRRLTRQLAAVAEQPDILELMRLKPQKYDWEVRLVRSRDVNAFCLPGGKIVVYTGIFPVAQTESSLAAVMGHEIAHALARHGAERMAQQNLLKIGQVAAAGSIMNMDVASQRQIMGILGAGAQYGVMLPFSRSHESEADRMGLILMAAAGHDPKAAVRLWQRMKKAGGSNVPEYASTHPSHERRIAEIEGWLEEVEPLYRRAPEHHPDAPLPDVSRGRSSF